MLKLNSVLGLAMILAVAGCTSEPAHYPIFFTQDATALTPEAHEVVVQIAERSAAQHPSRIIVEGQADGATGQETALADNRAARVAEALIAAGIDPSRIERHPGAPGAGVSGVAARKVLVTLEP